MSEQRRALLLIGSPKKPRNTSTVLGSHLMERLAEHGYETETLLIHWLYRSQEGLEELSSAMDRCDLLVLAFPLYVDSLPAPVIRTLEFIASRNRNRENTNRPRFAAIVNSGFPEAEQNQTALRICRRFAHEAGLPWAGGLALGGGEAINGRPLAEVKGMARNVIASLDLTAKALAAGEPVPGKAVRLMAKPIIWSRIYTWIGSRRWKREAARHGVKDRIRDRPYEQEATSSEIRGEGFSDSK